MSYFLVGFIDSQDAKMMKNYLSMSTGPGCLLKPRSYFMIFASGVTVPSGLTLNYAIDNFHAYCILLRVPGHVAAAVD